MAWCHVDQVPSVGYESWLVGSWLLAFVLGAVLAVLGRGRSGYAWRAAGVALMSVPVWMVLLVTVDDMAKTFCAQGDLASILPPPPASAPSADHFLSQASDQLMRNVGYPVAGLLLWFHGRERLAPLAPLAPPAPPAPLASPASLARTWTQKLAELVPMGRRGAIASFRLGLAFMPLLIALNLALVWLTDLQIRAVDENAYFGNLHAVAALALAVAAGVGEEVVFRGVMQQGLKRVLGHIVRPRLVAMTIAVLLQAVVFAYSHAGYGNPTLLLFNAAFAVMAGFVVERWGLGCAIALHTLIDLYAFFAQVPAPDAWFWGLMVIVTGAVAAAVWAQARRAVAWHRTRRHIGST